MNGLKCFLKLVVVVFLLIFGEAAAHANYNNGTFISLENIKTFFGSTADFNANEILNNFVLFKDSMYSTALEIAQIIPVVIKGLVQEADPDLQTVKELSKVFKRRINEENEKIWDLKMDVHLNSFLKDIRIGSDILVNNAQNMLNHNVSSREINGFKTFCRYHSIAAPDSLLSKIYRTLIENCKDFTENQKFLFVKGVEMLNNININLELKLKISYFCTMEEDLKAVKDIIEFIQEGNPGTLEKDINDYINKNRVFAPRCLLDYAYYGATCSRSNMARTITSIGNILQNVWVGKVICSSLTSVRHDDMEEELGSFYNNTVSYLTTMNRYYNNAMENSLELCDPVLINDSIKNYPNPLIIDKRFYPGFGDFILARLNDHSNPLLDRNVIVTSPKNYNTEYLYLCNNTFECQEYFSEDRQVHVFYIVSPMAKNENNSRIEINNQQQYLTSNIAKINSTIKAKEDVIVLPQMIDFLKEINVSLTGRNRFTKQLWLREWALIGDCQYPTTISTSNPTIAICLRYYFRNKGSTWACEEYNVFIFA